MVFIGFGMSFLPSIWAHISRQEFERLMYASFFLTYRSLTVSAALVNLSAQRLLLFEHLTTLTMDFSHEAITTQGHGLKRILSQITPATSRMCASLRSLQGLTSAIQFDFIDTREFYDNSFFMRVK